MRGKARAPGPSKRASGVPRTASYHLPPMPSNLPTALLPRLLPAVVCLVAGLPCQNEQTGEDVKTVEDARRAKAAARGERAAKGEAGETGEKDESDESLTPEQRLARQRVRGIIRAKCGPSIGERLVGPCGDRSRREPCTP